MRPAPKYLSSPGGGVVHLLKTLQQKMLIIALLFIKLCLTKTPPSLHSRILPSFLVLIYQWNTGIPSSACRKHFHYETLREACLYKENIWISIILHLILFTLMSFTCIKTLVGPHIESKLLPDTKSTLDSAQDLLDLSCNKKGAGLIWLWRCLSDTKLLSLYTGLLCNHIFYLEQWICVNYFWPLINTSWRSWTTMLPLVTVTLIKCKTRKTHPALVQLFLISLTPTYLKLIRSD